MINEETFTNSWKEEANGQTVRIKMRGTIFYPLGVAFETLEGSFSGSTYFIYYIPRNDNKTNVVVAGDFRSTYIDPTIDNDERLRSIILSTFDKVFNKDCEYLKISNKFYLYIFFILRAYPKIR